MEHIISTIGTSVYTNFSKDEVADAFNPKSRHEELSIKSRLRELEDYSAKGYDSDDFRGINKIINQYWITGIQKKGKNFKHADDFANQLNTEAAAEIKSIISIIEKSKAREFRLTFLATDTAIAFAAGKLLCDVFRKLQDNKTFDKQLKNSENRSVSIVISNEPIVVEGLQVTNGVLFDETGFDHLIKVIDKIKYPPELKGRKTPDELILNVTGGYKGTIPVLTILGQLLNIPLNYIYEESNELIEIKSLPVKFDYTITEMIYPYLSNHYIKKRDFVAQNPDLIKIMKEYSLIKEQEKDYEITFIGKIFNRYAKENLPEGKDALGILMEYKLYEYYNLIDKYENYLIERSVPLKEQRKLISDIDLVFTHNETDEFTTLECKSLTKVTRDFDTPGNPKCVKAQFIRQMEGMANSPDWGTPEKVMFVIYELVPRKNFGTAERLKPKMRELKQIVYETFGENTRFEAILLTVIVSPNKNPYADFLHQEVDEKGNFKTITV